jgi:hypothetical protein
MSFVIAAPELMASAATDLAALGSTVTEAHTAAAASTVALVPAAADEVSVGITHLFSQHAAGYHAVARQAAAFHAQFAANLASGAAAYTGIEATLASLLQQVFGGFARTAATLLMDFITSANSWIDLIPGPLQPFVIGLPILAIFIPIVLLGIVIQLILGLIGGA